MQAHKPAGVVGRRRERTNGRTNEIAGRIRGGREVIIKTTAAKAAAVGFGEQ